MIRMTSGAKQIGSATGASHAAAGPVVKRGQRHEGPARHRLAHAGAQDPPPRPCRIFQPQSRPRQTESTAPACPQHHERRDHA